MDERTALLYAQLKPFKALANKTSGFIRWALERVENPYVACSFGKDSSVMLHLVLQHKPDVQVNFMCKTETDLIDDYKSVINWWKQNMKVNINRISYLGWLEGATKTGIAKNMPTEGFDSYFVGIRKDESVGRRITLLKDGLFYKMKDGKTRISPMADWKVNDVAVYMLANNLPILRAYKREGFEARTTSNIPSKYPNEALARLKNADIMAYNKLLKILPDAKYYT
jgi:3'-phosphoadenosine 5'-phosphosulfate sulfotransferase (PAPS reductase)/FAD synthetase